jgi:hypothetical protein
VEEQTEAVVDAQELLRRHFEARFKPLAADAARAAPKKRANNGANDSDSDDSENSQDDDDSEEDAGQSDAEWGGVSDDHDMDGDEEGTCNC